MFIESLELKNFKCFGPEVLKLEFGLPDGRTTDSGLNILVGVNNTGKSTIFESILFLRNGPRRPLKTIKNNQAGPNEELFVKLTFSGQVSEFINRLFQGNQDDVFVNYIHTTGGENPTECLVALRSSRGPEKIQLLDRRGVFQNAVTADNHIRSLFNTDFIWADTNPTNQVIRSAIICSDWVKQVLESKPEPNQVNNNRIFINIDQINIECTLSKQNIRDLLSAYAGAPARHPEKQVGVKSFLLFIDEPELFLSPKEQVEFLEIILELSKTQQIFIATHSPHFLKNQQINNPTILLFKSAQNQTIKVENITQGGWSVFPEGPSWGEINYHAYKLPTEEFHNELYGYLQSKSNEPKIEDFDRYLNQQHNLEQSKQYQKDNNAKPQNITLCSYIRNQIHHPENDLNPRYTPGDLAESIRLLQAIAKKDR